MPRISTVPQNDDAGLLRYKYQRRERSVRIVSRLLQLAALALVLWSIGLVVEAAARNWSVGRSVRPGQEVYGPWEGARGQYHRALVGKLVIALPLALMLAIPGVGLPRFHPAARDYAAALAVILFVLSILAILVAITSFTPPGADPDDDLDAFPSPFYIGLLALGLGLPASAALFGFLRSHVLDPLFTPEYRDAIRRTPPLSRPNRLLAWAIAAALVLAVLAIGRNAVEAAASPPEDWLVPLDEPAAATPAPVQPDARRSTVDNIGRSATDPASRNNGIDP